MHVNAVLRLGDLHIEYHIRPVKLRALRVVHFPPVAGLRLFFKRQIIPARHGLVQRIGVFARGGQRLGDEAAVLTETGADVHTHSKIAVLEIQKARAVVDDGVGIPLPAAAYDLAALVKFVVIRRETAARVLQRGCSMNWIRQSMAFRPWRSTAAMISFAASRNSGFCSTSPIYRYSK